MRAAYLLLLLVPALAGCSGGPSEPAAPALDLDWSQPLAVITTPSEPFEQQGYIRAAWQGNTFAVDTEMEVDLPRFAQRIGDTYYASEYQMGWSSYTEADVVQRNKLSNRLVLWDLPRLLADSGIEPVVEEQADGSTKITLVGATDLLPGNPELELEIVAREGRLVEGRLYTPVGRESPFTFRPASEALGFEVGSAEPSMPFNEAQKGNLDAAAGHSTILGLIEDYQARRGSLPERVDSDALAVELLASGKSWPTNPFDGTPVSDQDGSGHFDWTRCGPAEAAYAGFGWDGPHRTRAFGAGCAGSSS